MNVSDLNAAQPDFPESFTTFPSVPQAGHIVRLYGEDEWFNEGTVTGVAHGYVHVDFGDWVQSWALDAVFYAIIDFQLVLLPKPDMETPEVAEVAEVAVVAETVAAFA